MDNEELEQDKAKDEALEKALEQETENETPSEDETFAKPDYESEIIKIIRSTTSPKVTREKLEDYHANDIADVLEKLTVVERKKLYNILNMDMLSDVFECIDDVSPYLEEMDIRKAVEIISSLEADTAVAALRGLDKVRRSVIIDLMDQESKKDIMLIASFDDDEIGSRMTIFPAKVHHQSQRALPLQLGQSFAGNIVIYSAWHFHHDCKGASGRLCICRVRLHWTGAHVLHGDFKLDRNFSSYVFQQDWNRSGSGIRTSYYNDQQPYSCYRLLWTELAVFA